MTLTLGKYIIYNEINMAVNVVGGLEEYDDFVFSFTEEMEKIFQTIRLAEKGALNGK